MKSALLLLTISLMMVGSVYTQAQEVKYPDSFNEPIPLFGEDVIGNRNYPISSQNSMAKAYFNQGMQLMFAFAKEDAARSFKEAQKNDPNCAICYWGEAWAWGSYLNGKMTSAEAPRAYAALQQAVQRVELFGSNKEFDMIDALKKRYVRNFNPDRRAVQDSAYANAMALLAKKYPNDLNIATLYADALFLLEPRRGYRNINDPDVAFLHSVLEGVLEKDIEHPGACHLYIHATESTERPELAEACSEFIGNSIPGASHIQHMPSHTWNRLGDWHKSVRANINAWHADMKAAYDKGLAIYPTHNLHMLLFAASMDGQGAVAIQAARDYEKLTGNNMYHVLTLIRFGRFEDMQFVSDRPANNIHAGVWDFGQGYVKVREGDLEAAKRYLKSVGDLANSVGGNFRFHKGTDLMNILHGILEGEIAWAEGDMDSAVRSFQRSISYYEQLEYDEPEPFPFAPHHWLGAAYVEMGQFNNALNTYRKELKIHPKNGWSLFGMKKAYEMVNRENEEVDAQFEEAWARSEVLLTGSKF